MKYIVSGKKVTTVSAEIEVEASTREEAVARFQEQHPELPVEGLEEVEGSGAWDVVGIDEVTGEYIFTDDEYHVGEDGIMILDKNLPDDLPE